MPERDWYANTVVPMPIAATRAPMAAYASPCAGVVPASPGWAIQVPGSGRAHRTMPADSQALLVQGRAADAGPGTTAIATRIARNDPRRSHFSDPPRSQLSDPGADAGTERPAAQPRQRAGRHVNVSVRASKVFPGVRRLAGVQKEGREIMADRAPLPYDFLPPVPPSRS